MVVKSPLTMVVLLASLLVLVRDAEAHCDTLNGPVVTAARLALHTNDVTPVLKWVREPEEAEVREAFRKTMAIRGLSTAVQELADRFFFETVVRLHRLGEGEPYTGLKDGTAINEAIQDADNALQEGDVARLARVVSDRVAAGLRERFARARELRQHADESVAAGRRYVAAYIEFLHFVEEVTALDASSASGIRSCDPLSSPQ